MHRRNKGRCWVDGKANVVDLMPGDQQLAELARLAQEHSKQRRLKAPLF